MKQQSRDSLSDLDPELRDQVIIAIDRAVTKAKIDAPRDPLAIGIGRKKAIYRTAATLAAIKYAKEFHIAPNQNVRITFTIGPAGSLADATYEWIKNIEERTFDIDFHPDIILDHQQDPRLNLKTMKKQDSVTENILDLGLCDYDLAPFSSDQAQVFIERLSTTQWEIIILIKNNNDTEEHIDDENEEEPGELDSDHYSITEIVDSFDEAKEYLNNKGILLTQDQIEISELFFK